MIVSQRGQYAVRAVFELAKRYGEGPVTAACIAEAEHIPVRFLENILAQLRQAGIVESVRGKEGGYRLRRAPRDVTVGDVIRVIEGPITDIDCTPARRGGRSSSGAGNECPLRTGCVLLPMWVQAHQAMMEVFDAADFEHLVEQERAADENPLIDYVI